MMRGSFPWMLDPADVWRMLCDGFNESEIAYIGGLTRFQARDLIARSRRLFSQNVKRRESSVTTERRLCEGVRVVSW